MLHALQELIFEGITAHWIDDEWKLRQTLLDFMEFQSPHMGANMAKLVSNTLVFYGLTDKLFCIMMDNASNNDTMACELSETLLIDHGVVWVPDTHRL